MSEIEQARHLPPNPTSPIQLIAIDVDGTLLDSSGKIRPRVERAIESALGAGREVILATGRRLHSVEPIVEQLGISTVILTDGTVIYDFATCNAIYERAMSSEAQRLAIELSLAADLPPILYESPAALGRVLAPPSELDNPETRRFLSQRDVIIRVSIAELERAERVVSIVAMGTEGCVVQVAERAEATASYALVVWKPSTAGYHHHTVSFAPRYTSKGAALTWYAKSRGVPLASTMAIGDYENDVSLVTVAGWGVAMGNAVPSVLRAANAVVADNDHDGLAEAIERWGIA